MDDPSILLVTEPISLASVHETAAERFGDMVKGVVDVERRIMALGAELQADEEELLLDRGSSQPDLWGINLYPDRFGTQDWVEFDSMINVRPSQGNRSRSVEDPGTRARIHAIVDELVRGDG